MRLFFLSIAVLAQTSSIGTSNFYTYQPAEVYSVGYWNFPLTLPRFGRVVAVGKSDENTVCAEVENNRLRCLSIGELKKVGHDEAR